MISVIVYGRNDNHGYNLHRRVALSLNCLAEVLTHDDDEIVFVDYNTRDQLPTLAEAIADTLTERCLSTLVVVRVRERIHRRLFGERTHLPIVEPVARNVGARHTKAANRWLLSTTTDMIFVPNRAESLSDVCERLPDGFYGLPRFELPEWLWEQLPRSDPRRALDEIEYLGRALQLGETITSHDETRFDAPGDFQLVLREEFFAIDGFDEEMLLGWHVDSNLSKRLFLRRGSIETLEDDLAGYHCNHHRTPTVYHATELGNDLGRFFVGLDTVDLTRQRESWGLVGEELELIRVGDRPNREFRSAILAATGESEASPAGIFDRRREKFSLEYDSRHIFSFVADALRSAPANAAIAYIGANSELQSMLTALLAATGHGELMVAAVGERESIVGVADAADVFIVDLGVDSSRFDVPVSEGTGDQFARARGDLVRVYEALELLVDLERRRVEREDWHRPFVLVNSAAVFWNAYVLANLSCSSTTPHSRVRNAIVTLDPDASDAARAAVLRGAQLVRWMTRHDSGLHRLSIRPGRTVEIASLDTYSGFGEGWTTPDRAGVWTQGPKAELFLSLSQPVPTASTLILSFDGVDQRPGESLEVSLDSNGARLGNCVVPPVAGQSRGQEGVRDTSQAPIRRPLAWLRGQARTHGLTRIRPLRWLFIRGLELRSGAGAVLGISPRPKYSWSVDLPPGMCATTDVGLELVVHEPVNWTDDRRRGLHLVSFRLD